MMHIKRPLAIVVSVVFLTGFVSVATLQAAETASVENKRFQVYLPNLFPGCEATSMSFREDNILIIQCLDGFGVYLPAGSTFIAAYRVPAAYYGTAVSVYMAGIAFDPFLIGAGIAYFEGNPSAFVFTGYSLSTN